MNDLRNGVLDINGFEINKDVLPSQIVNSLKEHIVYHNVTPSGKSESFIFRNICIYDRFFDAKLYFYLGQLEDIRLDSCCKSGNTRTFEEKFQNDCCWLKSILGTPTAEGQYGIAYKNGDVHIGVSYQPDNGRSGPDAFISLLFERS